MDIENQSTPPPVPEKMESIPEEQEQPVFVNAVFPPRKKFTETIGFKILFIVLLTLLLLIPEALISGLVNDRKRMAESARSEIADKWGEPQHVTGPVLVIPYTYSVTTEKGIKTERADLYVFPKMLEVNGNLESQPLYRGIYETVVYTSKLDISGCYNVKDLIPASIDTTKLLLKEASVRLGITDLRGICTKMEIVLDGKNYDVNDGGTDDLFQGSFGSAVAMATVDATSMLASDSIPFRLSLDLKGSKSLSFAPVGETTSIKISGDCTSPSFGGNFLPANREVTDSGFMATWNVISINRPYPQSFTTDISEEVGASEVSVDMLIPVDHYQKTWRAINYSVLVVVLTFISVLFTEIRRKNSIHVFQYLLVGLALVLFYSLLLSFTEHLAFSWSYLIAAVMTITMVTLYMYGVVKVKRMALNVGGVLAFMYAYIYVLLNLESYALLVGSVGLFIVLAVVMYYSLRIDWKGL